MNKYHMADKGLVHGRKPYDTITVRTELEGNFGYWCYFDENLFCQEREGCDNCIIKKRIGP